MCVHEVTARALTTGLVRPPDRVWDSYPLKSYSCTHVPRGIYACRTHCTAPGSVGPVYRRGVVRIVIVIVSHLEGKQEVEQLNPRPALSLCTGRCLLESSTLVSITRTSSGTRGRACWHVGTLSICHAPAHLCHRQAADEAQALIHVARSLPSRYQRPRHRLGLLALACALLLAHLVRQALSPHRVECASCGLLLRARALPRGCYARSLAPTLRRDLTTHSHTRAHSYARRGPTGILRALFWQLVMSKMQGVPQFVARAVTRDHTESCARVCVWWVGGSEQRECTLLPRACRRLASREADAAPHQHRNLPSSFHRICRYPRPCGACPPLRAAPGCRRCMCELVAAARRRVSCLGAAPMPQRCAAANAAQMAPDAGPGPARAGCKRAGAP